MISLLFLKKELEKNSKGTIDCWLAVVRGHLSKKVFWKAKRESGKRNTGLALKAKIVEKGEETKLKQNEKERIVR